MQVVVAGECFCKPLRFEEGTSGVSVAIVEENT